MPWDHTVSPAPGSLTFPPLPQPKLAHDLATPEDARLSWHGWWLYPKIVYLLQTFTCLRNNQAVRWLEWNRTSERECDVPTRPPSHCVHYCGCSVNAACRLCWFANRTKLLYTGTRRFQFDGLNSLQYRLVHVANTALYTHILVDIGKPPRGFWSFSELSHGRLVGAPRRCPRHTAHPGDSLFIRCRSLPR